MNTTPSSSTVLLFAIFVIDVLITPRFVLLA